MNDISRRSFLSAGIASLGAIASSTVTGHVHVGQSSTRYTKPMSWIWLEVLRVRFQLWHFRRELLPLLLRRPAMDAHFRHLGFDPPHQSHMAAYRNATKRLVAALPTNGDGVRVPPLDHDYVVSPLLSLEADVRDSRGLYRRCEDTDCIATYCWLSEQGMLWDLRSMGPRFPRYMLDKYATEIAGCIAGRRGLSNPVTVIRDAGDLQLLRAFTNMPLDTYWNLILPLFHIAPQSPSTLLTARRGNASLRVGGVERDMEHSYLYSSQMSMFCAFVMELFANNQLARIREIATLPQTSGNWHGFMTGQIFDVLYQKVIYLRRLISSPCDQLYRERRTQAAK